MAATALQLPLLPLKALHFRALGLSNVSMCSRNAEAWTEWNINGLRDSLLSHTKFVKVHCLDLRGDSFSFCLFSVISPWVEQFVSKSGNVI